VGRGGGVRRRRRQPEPHERAVRGQSLNAARAPGLDLSVIAAAPAFNVGAVQTNVGAVRTNIQVI